MNTPKETIGYWVNRAPANIKTLWDKQAWAAQQVEREKNERIAREESARAICNSNDSCID